MADDGMAFTTVVRNPLRYSRGVTLMATDGAADKVYVNTYKDGFDPIYLLAVLYCQPTLSSVALSS